VSSATDATTGGRAGLHAHPRSRWRGALASIAVAFAVAAGSAAAQHADPASPVDPHAAGAEAHAADAAHPSIMQVDPGLMIWTVVTFVVLLIVLRFTAWKPLQASLEAREKRIRDAVEGAERARRDSEELLARHQQMLDAAKDDARKIIEEGKADGLRLKHELAAQARLESEEMKARARRDLELATEQAKKELWAEATKMSTELAERIVRRSLDADDQRRLVDEVLAEYRAAASRPQ
jgi:F-type H+-transporting ATPase subunit b